MYELAQISNNKLISQLTELNIAAYYVVNVNFKGKESREILQVSRTHLVIHLFHKCALRKGGG